MSADEMFEELGYEKETETTIETKKYIDGIVVYKYKQGKQEKGIFFDKYYEGIRIYDGFSDIGDESEISMQELKAINKKCEELGWLDNE